MRPIALRFNGCRSYVEPQTIDFAGKQFVAIVGDTGSGKSTVLDAICYGLYNRCSWPSGTVSDLVAHGGDGTLSVEFTFSVADTVWRVERSTTPQAAAPAHRLVSVDTDAIVATGARAVTAHIRRIIGLDYDTFLRAVILPQGRFHELLRMGDTDRSKILKSVLGLDQLGAVREHAQALHSRLALRLAEYRQRRAAFLENPAQTLIEATGRQRIAQQRLGILQAAQHAVAEAKAAAASALERKAALERARDRLTRAIPDDAHTRYQAMLAAAADISRRREQIEHRLAAAGLEQQSAQGELDNADLTGTGVAAVASTISTLTVLANQLPQLDSQARRLQKDKQEILSDRADLERSKTALAELEKSVAAAKTAAETAAARLGAAIEAHAAADAALAIVRQAATVAHEADQRVAARRMEVAELTAVAQAAAVEAEEAKRTVVEREAEQARAIMRHAAAVAGAGCTTGDPCPVCTRTLPADFIAPADETTKTVEAAVRAARRAATRAGEKASAAAERAKIAEQETLATAVRQAADAATDLAQATARVQDLLGEVNLNEDDDDLLHSLCDALDAARSEYDKLDAAYNAAQEKHTTASSELPVRKRALAQRQAAHDDETAGYQTAVAGLHDAARNVPAAFRPAQALSLPEIDRVRAAAEQRQSELKRVTDQLAAAVSTLHQLHAAQQKLDNEHAEQVIRPAIAIRRQLDRLVDRAADAETLLTLPPHPQRPADSSLAEEAEWCTAMLKHTTQAVAGCNQQANQARLAVAAAGKAADQARRSCAADDEHLEQLIRLASTASHNASREIARATAHKPLTDELDRRINTAAPTVAALADLVALLADGKFIANAVRQRQLALLSAASQTLLTISGGRFGFADNFRIIDTDTGQPRDVRTLSGGETFQASLALALAVVELACRASGRVDSLFLDEGLGSLDSGMLRDALNALAAHSTAGRLVTVISHMRSITENADHVLVVKRSIAGSRARWATPEEREQIINDDLGRGQLT